jgi:hypothetical protein
MTDSFGTCFRIGFAAALMLSLTPALPAVSAAGSLQLPFATGEKLTFHLRWGIISAGEATLEVHPPEQIGGGVARHFVLTARTNAFIDVFYKVRQRIDAYCDVDLNHSLLYKEVHTVGRTRRDARIQFDWKNMEARYINFGKAEKPIPISPGAFDPLSVFYFSRLFDLGKTDAIERPVTDGKKCTIGRAEIIGRERVRVGDRTYDTYLVEPELKEVGGVFEKDKNAKIQIWVTADEKRIPVRLKSKVVIGSFVGDLVSIETIPFERKIVSKE